MMMMVMMVMMMMHDDVNDVKNNLKVLDKDLTRHGISGRDKRPLDFVAAFRRVIMVDDDVDDGEDDGDAGDGQHDGSVDSDDRVTHASTLFSTLCYICLIGWAFYCHALCSFEPHCGRFATPRGMSKELREFRPVW